MKKVTIDVASPSLRPRSTFSGLAAHVDLDERQGWVGDDETDRDERERGADAEQVQQRRDRLHTTTAAVTTAMTSVSSPCSIDRCVP
jgi:hypothetical protein